MSQELIVPEKPCESCPYRRDVPSGIWAREEYEKLRGYDENTAFGTFLCHHSPDMNRNAVCRGWLSVQCESAAARLAVLSGQVTDEQRYATPLVPLYASGNEAADAGIRGIKRPNAKARKLIDRLKAKRES